MIFAWITYLFATLTRPVEQVGVKCRRWRLVLTAKPKDFSLIFCAWNHYTFTTTFSRDIDLTFHYFFFYKVHV